MQRLLWGIGLDEGMGGEMGYERTIDIVMLAILRE